MTVFPVTTPRAQVEPQATPAGIAGSGDLLRATRTLGNSSCVGVAGFPCSQESCEQWLNNRSALVAHLRIHSGGKRLVCPAQGCGYVTAGSGPLTRHLRVHSPEKPVVGPQERCAQRLSRQDTLHEPAHTGEKPFVCPYEQCGRRFARRGGLRVHWRWHTGEKPFVCHYEGCGKRFAQSGDLVTHRRLHTGEKPFVCLWEGCAYAATQSGHLTRHLRVHSREKPFVCFYEGCGRRFRDSSTRQTHLSVHSGKKPFICRHCGHFFAYTQSLQRHLRHHTGKQSCDCSHEGYAAPPSSSPVTQVRVGSGEKSCVRLQKSRTFLLAASGSAAGHKPSHRNRRWRLERIDVSTQPPVARHQSPGVSGPVSAGSGRGLVCQSTRPGSDSLCPTTTALSGEPQSPDWITRAPDRAEPPSPWLGLPLSRMVVCGWPQPICATVAAKADWLARHADEHLSGSLRQDLDTAGRDAHAFLLTGDDKDSRLEELCSASSETSTNSEAGSSVS